VARTLTLLRTELLEITALLLTKLRDGTVVFPFNRIVRFADKYPLSAKLLAESINIDRDDFQWFFVTFVPFLGLRLHCQIIDNILSSDVLLYFDAISGTFRESEAYQALVKLRHEIRTFLRNQDDKMLSTAGAALTRGGQGKVVTIRVTDLVPMRSLADRAANIMLLARSLVRHLNGAPFEMPTMRPPSPFADEALLRGIATAPKELRHV
jgi:hypothetical protein